MAVVATTRVHQMPDEVARGLVAWAQGDRRMHVLSRVPTAREVLAWQARGERCVSLLEGEVPRPHGDAFDFAVHDLCHMEKFHDPEHHEAQVGFFRTVDAAWDGAFGRILATWDDAFREDVEHVVCDMNGSAVFLFAALKMKLKMAVRRRVSPGVVEGPLDARETRAFDAALLEMIAALGMTEILEAAIRVSTRRDEAEAAERLLSWCERRARAG